MNFGKQIEEHELPASAERNQQVVKQEVTNTQDATTTQQVSYNQTEDMNDATSSSPDFSNLTTDVGDNPYIRRPPPIESPPIPPRSPPTNVGYNPKNFAKYNLRPNPKLKRKKSIIRSPDRTDLTTCN